MIEIVSGAYQAGCGSRQGAYLMSPGYQSTLIKYYDEQNPMVAVQA
jgi:hypothetical protein